MHKESKLAQANYIFQEFDSFVFLRVSVCVCARVRVLAFASVWGNCLRFGPQSADISGLLGQGLKDRSS